MASSWAMINGILIVEGSKVYCRYSKNSKKRGRFIAQFRRVYTDKMNKVKVILTHVVDGSTLHRDLESIEPIQGRPGRKKGRHR